MESRLGDSEPRRQAAPPSLEVIPQARATSAPAEAAAKRKPNRRAVAAVAAAVAALAAAAYWLDARRFEETDDAQVDGEISNVSPRIAGTVKAVHVVENQVVRRGQLLVEIDPADLETALAEARAAVAAAEAQLRADDPTVFMTETSSRTAIASSASDLAAARASAAEARKAVEQAAAQLAQAEASDQTTQLERRRGEQLHAGQAVSEADLDQRINAARASSANLEAMRRALEAARERVTAQDARVATIQSRATEVRANAPRELETRQAVVAGRRAALDLARARLAQAELNLGYAKITAPADGIVGKKSVAVGDRVAPGQEIVAIAQVGDLWVTANFRETQLRHLRPGQRADIYVDGLDLTLRGQVESLGGATGSRYSVLPPENATGNYVKVVQRLPVRLRLDAGQVGVDRLRPGLSVEPKVKVR
ncbi:MAG TPA: HlyD family secretion protein [Polyangia bacterium]|nr:HlyD family secretion protein [Polyangia bacterium]